MCFTAKASVSAWWILVFIALFLWYRGENYDRALAIFVFTLGLIQLIEFGIHSGADPSQAGMSLFLTLWLQCLVLAIGVYIFITNLTDHANVIHTLAGLNLLLFSVIFVVALIFVFLSGTTFDGQVGSSGHIEWFSISTSGEKQSLLGQWWWLYVIGIFFPLILIFSYYHWANLGIALLILYGALSAAYVIANYPPQAFSSMWCYLAVGFAFLAWFIGIIPQNNTNTCT